MKRAAHEIETKNARFARGGNRRDHKAAHGLPRMRLIP